jgi:1,4-dihydroxy-2-naphthoate polyprenyltransferase
VDERTRSAAARSYRRLLRGGTHERRGLVAWLGAFVRLGRPHFLAGGFLLNGLGTMMALYGGVPLNLAAFAWGQVVITAGQWMTHYSNDFYDLHADRANRSPARWSGGSRVLADGYLPPKVALVTALVLAGLALLATLVLAVRIRPGPLTLLLPLLALGLAWSYSAPPLQLHSRGLGELTTALVVPALTPLLGFYLQTGRLATWPLLALWPLASLQFAMLLSIEFPDAASDASVGKRTLVVRLGGVSAGRLFGVALLAAYTPLPLFVRLGLPAAVALGAGLGAPLAVWQAWRVLRGAWSAPDRWESIAFWSIALLLGTAGLELLAFWLLL